MEISQPQVCHSGIFACLNHNFSQTKMSGIHYITKDWIPDIFSDALENSGMEQTLMPKKKISKAKKSTIKKQVKKLETKVTKLLDKAKIKYKTLEHRVVFTAHDVGATTKKKLFGNREGGFGEGGRESGNCECSRSNPIKI